MDDTHELERQAEEARLMARTQELQRRTDALSRDRTSFDAAAHQALQQDLEIHHQELVNYRARLLAKDPPKPN